MTTTNKSLFLLQIQGIRCLLRLPHGIHKSLYKIDLCDSKGGQSPIRIMGKQVATSGHFLEKSFPSSGCIHQLTRESNHLKAINLASIWSHST